jgi:hypothetical protein
MPLPLRLDKRALEMGFSEDYWSRSSLRTSLYLLLCEEIFAMFNAQLGEQ